MNQNKFFRNNFLISLPSSLVLFQVFFSLSPSPSTHSLASHYSSLFFSLFFLHSSTQIHVSPRTLTCTHAHSHHSLFLSAGPLCRHSQNNKAPLSRRLILYRKSSTSHVFQLLIFLKNTCASCFFSRKMIEKWLISFRDGCNSIKTPPSLLVVHMGGLSCWYEGGQQEVSIFWNFRILI